MATISREKVLDSWFALVKDAAGKDQWVMETTQQAIEKAAPNDVGCRIEEVNSGFFSQRRNFLIVTHNRLREYAMFIGARDFGRDLDVSWYQTVHPGFLKRAISKRLTMGDPNALSMNINVFAQQDLSAYKQLAHECLQETLQTLMSGLKQDYSTIDRKSKGFLSVW
jgi:hypothetical protein